MIEKKIKKKRNCTYIFIKVSLLYYSGQINNSDEWLDEMIFNFKRKVHSWSKETNKDGRCS